MITGRSTDPRNPSKILRMPISLGSLTTSANPIFQMFSHFRGLLVGLQISSSNVSGGTIRVVVTDSTKSTTLLDTGVVTPTASSPYLAEFLPTTVNSLPAPDSNLDQLPLINSGDTLAMQVILTGSPTISNAVLTLEFQGV